MPVVTRLSSNMISAYSPWMYQRIEVVPGGEPITGYLGLVWCGEERSERVSLSHTGDMSCACLTFGEPVAIDMEIVVPRTDAFYRVNFTEVERNWACRSAGGDAFIANRFFTMLWALKESALKIGSLEVGIWDIPAIQIEALPRLEAFAEFSTNQDFGTDFVFFAVEIRKACRCMKVHVAASGTDKLILTLIISAGGVAN